MYKWLTSYVWPGPDILQVVPTLLQTLSSLVLNVDLLMIFFMRVKGPVGSIYCRQRMFLSCWMLFFHTQNFYNGRRKVYAQINTDIHSHSVCVCDCCHVQIFRKGSDNVKTNSVSCLFVFVCVCRCVCLCLFGGVSQNLRNCAVCVCVCVCVCCVRVCVNLCDLVLNYCRHRLFLSCFMIFSYSIMTDYVQMMNQ